MQALQQGSTLQGGRYRIERVLGQGGFGITYLAEDCVARQKVAIKEFFMRDYCSRDESTAMLTETVSRGNEMVATYKRKFIKEAKTLSSLNHPNVVRVFGDFEENGTAYYIMEYIEGLSLDTMVRRMGALDTKAAKRYFLLLAEALSYIHSKKINHLDIKPTNIMIRASDNQPVLIDFGVSKHYDVAGSQTTSTPVGVSNGYAPLEQYIPGGLSCFSPQADIYSLGAVLYFMVTGAVPPSAHEVLGQGVSMVNVPVSWRKVINACMKPKQKERPACVSDVVALLSTTHTTPRTTPRQPSTTGTSTASPRSKKQGTDFAGLDGGEIYRSLAMKHAQSDSSAWELLGGILCCGIAYYCIDANYKLSGEIIEYIILGVILLAVFFVSLHILNYLHALAKLSSYSQPSKQRDIYMEKYSELFNMHYRMLAARFDLGNDSLCSDERGKLLTKLRDWNSGVRELCCLYEYLNKRGVRGISNPKDLYVS